MTAQAGERLRYQGKDLTMCTTPLCDYFAMGGNDPGFQFTCTALWRGYVGSWEFIDGRLYLNGISGNLKSDEPATLETVFPGFPDRVFAHWYSGTIRIPQGELLKYVHMGYGSTYERDLLLVVEHGVLVATHERSNGTTEPTVGQQGYQVGAMTVFHKRSDNKGADE